MRGENKPFLVVEFLSDIVTKLIKIRQRLLKLQLEMSGTTRMLVQTYYCPPLCPAPCHPTVFLVSHNNSAAHAF